jgi:tRNA (guanine26-N2/guanine27-N2)-dimethyltransferase
MRVDVACEPYSLCSILFVRLTLSQIAGPMWSGPLHDSAFVGRVLEHLEENRDHYGTAVRMKGMLTLAKEVRTQRTMLADHSKTQ